MLLQFWAWGLRFRVCCLGLKGLGALAGLRLAGNEGMEKKMETTIMGYIPGPHK